MTTVLEIQKPKMSYCKKYDIHCECPKCEKPTKYCIKAYKPNQPKQPNQEDYCDICTGPTKEDEEIIAWHNKDNRDNVGKIYKQNGILEILDIGECLTMACQQMKNYDGYTL